jgi:hypothetical protein
VSRLFSVLFKKKLACVTVVFTMQWRQTLEPVSTLSAVTLIII